MPVDLPSPANVRIREINAITRGSRDDRTHVRGYMLEGNSVSTFSACQVGRGPTCLFVNYRFIGHRFIKESQSMPRQIQSASFWHELLSNTQSYHMALSLLATASCRLNRSRDELNSISNLKGTGRYLDLAKMCNERRIIVETPH